MKKLFFAKAFILCFALMFVSLNSNSYSNINLSQQAKASAAQSSITAISTENMVVINYSLISFNKAFIIITDVMGNRISVVKISSKTGKLKIKKSELDQAGGNGVYTCTVQVDGCQIISQPVTMINN